MTTSRKRSLAVLACLPAIFAGVGCGDDDDDTAGSATPPAATQPASTPSTASEPPAEEPEPAADAAKPTADQLKAMRTANNNIALEEDSADFSRTGPMYAENHLKVAEPLAAGPCKDALEAVAANWTKLAKADADEDAAAKKSIGGKMLDFDSDVYEACG